MSGDQGRRLSVPVGASRVSASIRSELSQESMYPVPTSRPFCPGILIIVNFDLWVQRKALKLLNATPALTIAAVTGSATNPNRQCVSVPDAPTRDRRSIVPRSVWKVQSLVIGRSNRCGRNCFLSPLSIRINNGIRGYCRRMYASLIWSVLCVLGRDG
jgi:hypothetical protein